MIDLPRTCRVAVVQRSENGDYTFNIEEHPIPSPGPLEVLVKLSVTGVCGTDISLAAGKLGPSKVILGHEGVGRVALLGSAVSPTEVKIGQRLGVGWIRDRCGSCAMCSYPDGETRCVEKVHSGRSVDGTFAEYTIVPARYITALPEGLKDEVVAPIMCGGVTVYKALKICGATPGQWIAISGAGGGVGALGIQYAKAMGYRVLAVDAGNTKREYCMDLGADAYIDCMVKGAMLDGVRRATDGKGVQAVLAVAGSVQAYQESFHMMAPFATLVCIGIPPPTDLIQFHPLQFIDMGFKVVGTSVGSRTDIVEALEFVRRGQVKPSIKMTTLEGLNQVKEDFLEREVLWRFVVRIAEDL